MKIRYYLFALAAAFMVSCSEEKLDEKSIFTDLEIGLPCEKDLLHPAIKELLEALEGLGATVSYTAPQAAGESNLAKVTRLLRECCQ